MNAAALALTLWLGLDASPAAVLARFPDARTTVQVTEWGWHLKIGLEAARGVEVEDPEFFADWLVDLAKPLDAWGVLLDAHKHHALDVKGWWLEQDLVTLSNRIGPEAFSLGRMPRLDVPPRRLYAPWRR